MVFGMYAIRVEGGFEHVHGAGEVVHVVDVGEAHLIASLSGGGVETGGRSHEDGVAVEVEFVEAPFAEIVGILHGECRHGVERPHRHRTVDAGDLVETVYQEIAAAEIFVVDVFHVFLRRGDRRLRHDLAKKRRTETRLAEFHDIGTKLLMARHDGTDTDAALVVALRNGVDEHRILLYARKRHD